MPSPPKAPMIQLGPVSFPPLNLAPFNMHWKVNSDGTGAVVWCLVRKKFVALEPEEWVRQHWLNHLNASLGYPFGLMAVEHAMSLNGMTRFADVVCHNTQGRPLLLVELKRPTVPLSSAVLDQVLRYHLTVQTPLFVISNGMEHQGFRFQAGQFQALKVLPAYAE